MVDVEVIRPEVTYITDNNYAEGYRTLTLRRLNDFYVVEVRKGDRTRGHHFNSLEEAEEYYDIVLSYLEEKRDIYVHSFKWIG